MTRDVRITAPGAHRRRSRGNALTHGITARTCLPPDIVDLIEALSNDIASGDTDPVVKGYASEIARVRIAALRAGLVIEGLIAPLAQAALGQDRDVDPVDDRGPSTQLRRDRQPTVAPPKAGLGAGCIPDAAAHGLPIRAIGRRTFLRPR